MLTDFFCHSDKISKTHDLRMERVVWVFLATDWLIGWLAHGFGDFNSWSLESVASEPMLRENSSFHGRQDGELKRV